MTEPIQVKTCSRCKELKPLRLFRWLKKHHRGRPEIHRDSWCYDCRRDYKKTPKQKSKRSERWRYRWMNDPEFRADRLRKDREYYQKHRERILARVKDYERQKGGGSLKLGYLAGRLKEKFGITLEQYYAMSEAQGHRCAICGCYDRTKTRRLAVDHDHETDVVRALLCHHCNTGLGNFGDNIALLWNAIQYLSKHSAHKIKEVG